MKRRAIRVQAKLVLGFLILFLLVLALGILTNSDSTLLFQKEEAIYAHPLQVRTAVGAFETDIADSRTAVLELLDSTSPTDRNQAETSAEQAFADAQMQYDEIRVDYLGPSTDVDKAYADFIAWRTLVRTDIREAVSGISEGSQLVLEPQGIQTYRSLMDSLEAIDTFAMDKADQLHKEYTELVAAQKVQVDVALAVVALSIALFAYLITRSVRKPLRDLTTASARIRGGDLGARSATRTRDEFGDLAAGFNAMAETIQMKIDLDDKASRLVGAMLGEDDARRFFQNVLAELSTHVGAQMASVYLLGADGRTYDHFESIGLDRQARASFDAMEAEGEFGLAIRTRKILLLEDLPEDTRFAYSTPGGDLVPRNLLVLPIEGADGTLVAMLALGSVKRFDAGATGLLETTLATLSARIESVLQYKMTRDFKEALEIQNHELEAQKNELTAQSTELSRQNVELEAQKRQLAEASLLKTAFLSNMSHELRTPLNSVIALSGVLRRRLNHRIPVEETEYLEVIERNGKELLLLINDILDISRIESGREEIENDAFDLGRCARDTVDLIEPVARSKGISLKYLSSEVDLSIVSDADKVRHILQNLVGNAVKFTQSGGVTVEARRLGDRYEVDVADTGIGIAEDQFEQIFEEFRQADNSTSRRFGGTGLGLSLARKYAVLLGGDVAVRSRLGEGSVFTLGLPLRNPHATPSVSTSPQARSFARPFVRPAVSDAPPPVNGHGAGKTLLLVEDSEPAIVQIGSLLEETRYTVHVARNAREAMDRLADGVPDAIVLDLMMPGTDGFGLLEALRVDEKTSRIPVLILTAKHITKEDLVVLEKYRVQRLIQKGDVNRAELLASIHSLLVPPAPARRAPRPPARLRPVKPLVLVVEDNPDSLLTVRALLGTDYEVLEAVDGPSAVEKARRRHPDLVLMDIALPGITGIEAFHAIRSSPGCDDIPIVALTASAMENERDVILAHGFDGYLSKPIDAADFHAAVERGIHGS